MMSLQLIMTITLLCLELRMQALFRYGIASHLPHAWLYSANNFFE
jgi:hypothetical protein